MAEIFNKDALSSTERKLRKILQEHGISDKDKLETLPPALANYIAEIITVALGAFVQDMAEGNIKIYMPNGKIDPSEFIVEQKGNIDGPEKEN